MKLEGWVEFKRTFTQEQEDAIAQYLADHATPMPNGYYRIMFHVNGIDDFWQRVHARHTGAFRRYDPEKLEKERKQMMQTFYIYEKHARRMGKKCDYINTKGTWIEKLALWVYRKAKARVLKVNTLPLTKKTY